MAEQRLRTDFWLMAQIRQSMAAGIPMIVVAKGDAVGGAVLIKLNQFELGCTVLSQTRDAEGNAAWLRATGAEPIAEDEADRFITRQRGYDPDLWVVEIEDRQGRLPFSEKIL